MAIAIKELTAEDERAFASFLRDTPRDKLPELLYSPLAWPHEDMAVFHFKKAAADLRPLAEARHFFLQQHGAATFSLSRRPAHANGDFSKALFSGYVFYDGKFLLGSDEIFAAAAHSRELAGKCGEFCLCEIAGDQIRLSADFFGMVPWFYYEDDAIFAASNHYHLLLLSLGQAGVRLRLNVKRARVNMITSGFTFGAAFSEDLDIQNCRIALASDIVNYSPATGLWREKTELWRILTQKQPWDEELYERLIFAARDEMTVNVGAALASPHFDRAIIDVSGGFDSRAVFAAASRLPRRLRAKIRTHTRKSGTADDREKGAAVCNVYGYPRHAYGDVDGSALWPQGPGRINLAQVSRTLGIFAVNSHVYTATYTDRNQLELTGYLGEVVLGYMRCRGELDYKLGDRRLLARLGGCYLHNSVEQLKGVFQDQEEIINGTLKLYADQDCLFKKFQMLYADFRNRFICGSAHNIENNNLRLPMCFSVNALRAKWMYFNRFHDNVVPDEKISMVLNNALNPLLGALPYAAANDLVLAPPQNLLAAARLAITPDTAWENPKTAANPSSYRNQVLEFMDDLEVPERMLLALCDHSEDFYPACLGMYAVLRKFREQPEDARSSHGRETVRKIYDAYWQMRLCA